MGRIEPDVAAERAAWAPTREDAVPIVALILAAETLCDRAMAMLNTVIDHSLPPPRNTGAKGHTPASTETPPKQRRPNPPLRPPRSASAGRRRTPIAEVRFFAAEVNRFADEAFEALLAVLEHDLGHHLAHHAQADEHR